MIIKANYIDIEKRQIFAAEITIENKIIKAINAIDEIVDDYILPGFIDAHIHIESSMVLPSEFAKVAVLHGTVATVSDPHEIANVMGVQGVYYMIDNSKTVPFNFFFGAPSCVPATIFETAGASIDAKDIQHLMQSNDIWYLAEVMNYPAVINHEEEIIKKVNAAHQVNKPVDGHAPALTGNDLQKYISAGISTDHECFTYNEGLEKLKLGMKVIIREGSAAKNFDALIPLIKEFPKQIMFCSDDKHPDDLQLGHINQLVMRALNLGYDLFDTLHAACVLPVKHYKLPVGQLKINDSADFIIVNNLLEFNIKQTFIKGQCVAQQGISNIKTKSFPVINYFNCKPISASQLKVKSSSNQIKIIEAYNRQLITGCIQDTIPMVDNFLCTDTTKDILKIVVVNRYFNAAPAVAFIKNFGLKEGAIASCIAHDSHNIVAVGVDDESIARAINLIIENKGGISVAHQHGEDVLALPVAGIMSNHPVDEVAAGYQSLHYKAKELGCKLDAPYMSLSFMALLVIPALKLSDKGLFDGVNFELTSLN
ncbi:MAG TPA: adenine deaminase [Bacteroidia bacterium]|nr:adenine deaminase [Bacteroidia bacterium]